MKMPNTHAVSTSGPMEGFTAAQIAPEDMAQAMRMFSSNYSRPKDAVLRELAANALDSQREARVDSPVEITLPTIDHPEVRISDSGLGLSVDDILETFGNYLKSTKRDSDTQLGTFGIGSKAPHAVADQYHVTAVKDGVRVLVLFAKRDGGVPGHKIISTEPTDAPNGVTVTVPVSLNALEGWITAAKRVFYWWDPFTVTVRAQGEEPLEIDSYLNHIDEIQSTETVRLLDAGHRSVARIGTIGYDIPAAMWREQNISFDSTLVFEIGLDAEISIAHSRETIEDTEDGRAILKELFEGWKTAQNERYQRELDLATTTYEVVKIEASMNNDVRFNGHGSPRRLWDLLDRKGLPTGTYMNMTRFFGDNPRTSVDLEYPILVPMAQSRCVLGTLDDRAVRALRKWRRAHGFPSIFVIPDASALMPMIDPSTLSWITIEEMIAQTPKEPARPRNDDAPVLSVITGLKFRDTIFDQIEMDTEDVIAAVAAGATIVAGTKAEYDEIIMDRHRWVVSSDPALPVDRLRNAIKIMRGGRSLQSMAKLLGTEVLSPREYLTRLRRETVDAMTKKQRQRLAEHSQLRPYYVDLMKAASLEPNLDPKVKKALVKISDLVGEPTVHTQDELLLTEPSLPKATLHQDYPLFMELMRHRTRNPSAELLNAVVQADHSNQKKGSA